MVAGCGEDEGTSWKPTDGERGARDARAPDAAPPRDSGTGDAAADPTDAGLDGSTDEDAALDRDAGDDRDAALDRRDAGDAGNDERDAGPLPDDPPATPCGPAPLPTSASLCGTAGDECVLLRDERIDEPHFRNDAPSIAVSADGAPRILYSIAESGYFGYLAVRDGTWTTVGTTFPLATGSLAIEPDGDSIAAIYDGALHTHIFRRSSAGWEDLSTFPSDDLVRAGRLALDSGGCVSIAANRTAFEASATHYQLDGARWNVHRVAAPGASGPGQPALVLSPSGRAQLAWSVVDGASGYSLWWAEAGSAPEVAWRGGTYDGTGLAMALGTTGDATAATPHLLLLDPTRHATRVLYATRAGDGSWSSETVATGTFAGCDPDSAPPTTDGVECNFAHRYFVPPGVVTSGSGDVRFVLSEVREEGNLVSRCGGIFPGPPGGGGPPPPPGCRWEGPRRREGSLAIAAPGSAPLAVVDAFDAASATVALDAAGRIHVAAYELMADAPSGTAVRYAMLGRAIP